MLNRAARVLRQKVISFYFPNKINKNLLLERERILAS